MLTLYVVAAVVSGGRVSPLSAPALIHRMSEFLGDARCPTILRCDATSEAQAE